jgi:hypothetical protein
MFSGLKRGLQLIGLCGTFMVKAAKAKDEAALTDALDVVKLWVLELFGEGVLDSKLDLKNFQVNLLRYLTGADPFKESRVALQALRTKYPKY